MFTRLTAVDAAAALAYYADGALAPLTPALPPTELAAAVGVALPPAHTAGPRRGPVLPGRRGVLALVESE